MTYHIHPIPEMPEGDRLFCGPTVLCALTGKTPTQVRRAVNRHRGNKWNAAVTSMWQMEFQELMHKWKLKPKSVYPKKTPTLKTFSEDMQFVKNPIVVNVTGHFVLLYQGVIYDTHRKEGCPFEEHPNAGKWVRRYWVINKRCRK